MCRYDEAIDSLAALMEVATFASRVRHVASRLHSTNRLNDLLITPIQRPPRYLLLLERARDALVAADAARAAGGGRVGGGVKAAGIADGRSADAHGSALASTAAAAALSPVPAPSAAQAALAAAVVEVRAVVSALNEAKRECDAFTQVSAAQRAAGAGRRSHAM